MIQRQAFYFFKHLLKQTDHFSFRNIKNRNVSKSAFKQTVSKTAVTATNIYSFCVFPHVRKISEKDNGLLMGL